MAVGRVDLDPKPLGNPPRSRSPLSTGPGVHAKLMLSARPSAPALSEKSQQSSALGGPRSSSDHDDDAVVRSLSRELEEVIAIARDDDQIAREGVVENRRVGGLARKRLARATHLVSKVLEEIAQRLRDIIVQEEVHRSPADICRATRTSISPR